MIKKITLFLLVLSSSLLYSNPIDSSALSIIGKYYDAVGGKSAFDAVEDRTVFAEAFLNNISVGISTYQKKPFYYKQEYKISGLKNVVVYNGSEGVSKVNGKSFNYVEDELEKLRYESCLDLYLSLVNDSIPFVYNGIKTITFLDSAYNDSLNNVISKDTAVLAHEIEITFPSGNKWFQYFDQNSYLKIKETKEVKSTNANYNIYFSNYKKVGKLLVPHRIIQIVNSQVFYFKISNITFNKKLKEKIFN